MYLVKSSFIYLLLVLLATNCQESESLVGTWDSQYLKTTINTYHNGDSTISTDANPTNYQKVIGLKTARVKFNVDGTYIEHYIRIDGSVAYSQQGYWFIRGDTVVTAVYKPLKSQAVYRYHMEIYRDSAVFTSLMDYDKDGLEDDEFWGVSKRID